MIWYIWWLAIVAGLGILIAVAVRTFDDDTEFVLPAAEIQAIEEQRRAVLAAAPLHVDEHTQVRDAALARGMT
jgi:cytochrome o ubiquinol oxidase subunit 1